MSGIFIITETCIVRVTLWFEMEVEESPENGLTAVTRFMCKYKIYKLSI